jgi:hypothetical protein
VIIGTGAVGLAALLLVATGLVPYDLGMLVWAAALLVLFGGIALGIFADAEPPADEFANRPPDP